MTTAQINGPEAQRVSLLQKPLGSLPNLPLVSILISNYNYGCYLSDSIKSSLQQTYENVEVIVCDDGSTDLSHDILEHYCELDSRVKAIYQVHRGQSASLNAAFLESSGEIVCLLDADDIFLPDKVKSVVEAFSAAPCSGLAVHTMLLMDGTGKHLADVPSLFELPQGWHGSMVSVGSPQMPQGMPPTSAISLRRPIAQAIFPLPTGLKAYSDTLIQVLAPMMTPIVAIETPMSEYRIHGGNIGGVKRFTQERLRNIALYEKEIWAAWRRYLASPHSGFPPYLPLPPETTVSPMDYAYARFQGEKNFRSVYYSIHPPRLQTLARFQQWYWRASLAMPNWLFRRSFDFAYGHTRTKMLVRRILKLCRRSSAFAGWVRGNMGKQELRPASPNSHSTESPGLSMGSPEIGKSRTKRRQGEEQFQVLGLRINSLQMPDVIARMKRWINDRGWPRSIAATSMHGIVEAQRDPGFKEVLNAIDLVVPDGMPLVWIARWYGLDLPGRVYGPDLLLSFCKATEEQGYRHFFYGGKPGVAEQLADSLRRSFPTMKIAGTYSPPFRPLSKQEDNEAVAMIAHAAPDVLWVGLGTPKQERWMQEHKNLLNVPVLVGVGAAFDMISGRRRQAPRWMREHGLEWLFRLCQEPRRLWRRYLIYGSQFIASVALETLRLKRSTSNAHESKP